MPKGPTPVRVNLGARWKAARLYRILASRAPKREPTAPAANTVLPMELQVDDRLADETGAWESSADRSRRLAARTRTSAFSELARLAPPTSERGERQTGD